MIDKKELKTKYENLKDVTRRFSHWNELDAFVEELINSSLKTDSVNNDLPTAPTAPNNKRLQ